MSAIPFIQSPMVNAALKKLNRTLHEEGRGAVLLVIADNFGNIYVSWPSGLDPDFKRNVCEAVGKLGA